MSDANSLTDRRSLRRERMAAGPSTAPSSAPPTSPPPESPEPSELKPIDDGAKSGKRIVLRLASGREVEASWRTSRRVNPKTHTWEIHGFFSAWNSAGMPIADSPVGWREIDWNLGDAP